MPRILLTGATGVLGEAVRREAARGGRFVVVPASRTPCAPGWVRLELTEPESLRAAVAETRPDACIHAAAVTDPVWAEANVEAALHANRDGTAVLAEACRRAGARFVALSTDLVFPGRDGGAYREEDEASPLSAYGRSKLAGEQAALAAHPGALVVRTSLLLAPGRGHIARLARVLAPPATEAGALAAGATLFTDERRSPVLATDVAGALLELLDSPASGLLHVAGPEGMTRFEMGQRVARALGLNASRIHPALRTAAPPPPRPGDVTLLSARATAIVKATRLRRIDEAPEELGHRV